MTRDRYTLIATGIIVGMLGASIVYDHRATSQPGWWELFLSAAGVGL